MKAKRYNVSTGLACLLIFIPTPTLLHEQFNNLITNDTINTLQWVLHGCEAKVLLAMMSITSLGLLVVALYELGGYMTSINNNNHPRLPSSKSIS